MICQGEFAIIDDGYTRRSGINGIPGMYPPIAFTWRGLTVRQRAKHKAAQDRLRGQEEMEQAGADLLANLIIEWDVCGPRGPGAINGDTMMTLHPAAFNRLYGIVTMLTPPDWDDDPSFGIATRRGAEQGTTMAEYLEKN